MGKNSACACWELIGSVGSYLLRALQTDAYLLAGQATEVCVEASSAGAIKTSCTVCGASKAASQISVQQRAGMPCGACAEGVLKKLALLPARRVRMRY